MKLRCALCGKPTEPFAFVGAMAVGPKCAKRAGLISTKTRKGSSLRLAKPTRRGAETPDLFDNLEDDDGTSLPMA